MRPQAVRKWRSARSGRQTNPLHAPVAGARYRRTRSVLQRARRIPICCATKPTHEAVDRPLSSTRLVHTATTGTTSPSLRPDSTFNASRSRAGTLSSERTALPSAASVGARTAARSSAWAHGQSSNSRRFTSAPARIVSGSPIPSSRPGIAMNRRTRGSDNRLASLNRMTASVTSARRPTAPISAPTSTMPSADRAAPVATKTIGIVSGEESSRRETAAKASRVTPTIAISMGSTTGTVPRLTIVRIPVVALSPS